MHIQQTACVVQVTTHIATTATPPRLELRSACDYIYACMTVTECAPVKQLASYIARSSSLNFRVHRVLKPWTLTMQVTSLSPPRATPQSSSSALLCGKLQKRSSSPQTMKSQGESLYQLCTVHNFFLAKEHSLVTKKIANGVVFENQRFSSIKSNTTWLLFCTVFPPLTTSVRNVLPCDIYW